MTQQPGADNWYLEREGQVYGPYSLDALRFILQDQRARLTDLAGPSERGPWRPLGEVVGAAPPPPPPPAVAAPPPPSRPRQGAGWWVLGVVLCLALFVAIPVVAVWPQYRQAQAKSAAATAQAALRQVGLALEMYAQDNGGRLPPAGQWEEAVGTVLRDPAQLRGPGGEAYTFNESLAGKPLREVRRTPGQVLAGDPSRYGEDYGLALYADGTVKSASAAP